MKTQINTIEDLYFELSEEAVKACSHAGRCDDDVKYWVGQFEWNVPEEALLKFCKEWNLSAEDGEPIESLQGRVLWVQACNRADEGQS